MHFNTTLIALQNQVARAENNVYTYKLSRNRNLPIDHSVGGGLHRWVAPNQMHCITKWSWRDKGMDRWGYGSKHYSESVGYMETKYV